MTARGCRFRNRKGILAGSYKSWLRAAQIEGRQEWWMSSREMRRAFCEPHERLYGAMKRMSRWLAARRLTSSGAAAHMDQGSGSAAEAAQQAEG